MRGTTAIDRTTAILGNFRTFDTDCQVVSPIQTVSADCRAHAESSRLMQFQLQDVQIRERLMRTRQWLASLLSGCLAVAGGLSAYAQAPPFPQYGPGNPDAVGMLPPPYNSNYGTVPQSYTGMEQAGYPPGANAWPNVSPYMGPAMDQTTNENGTWFNRQFTGNRQYYFSTEALIGSTQRGSNALIGAPGVNILPVIPGTPVNPLHNQQFVETVNDPNQPNRTVTAAGGGGGGGTGDIQIFAARHYHNMPDPSQSSGVRATLGWFNPDQSGFQASGFWLNTSNSSYFSGTGLPYDILDAVNPLITNYNRSHLRAFSGIPLLQTYTADHDSDDDGRPGVVQPFDIFYQTRFETQLLGSNVDWYWSSIYDRSSLMIRPLGGARFLQIREQFIFDGSDSGLGYTIQGARAQAGGGGGAAAGGQVFSPLIIETAFSIPDVMNSNLTSRSQSLLAGPEAGLRFDMGSDKFKIWGQSKFGLLANNTQRKLSGFNIGDAYYVQNGRTTPVMPRDRADLTAFASQDTSTWLSPMFEQSIFLKSQLFQYVPVLNKARILNQADFQLGYTILVVGQVARPTEQIDWQAYVDDDHRGPLLKTERSTFTNSTISLGVEWAY